MENCIHEPIDSIAATFQFDIYNVFKVLGTQAAWVLYFWFIVELVMEQRIYWLFVIFQKNTPFNQLDQKRSQY